MDVIIVQLSVVEFAMNVDTSRNRTDERNLPINPVEADLILDWLECILVGKVTTKAQFVVDNSNRYEGHLRDTARTLRDKIHKVSSSV